MTDDFAKLTLTLDMPQEVEVVRATIVEGMSKLTHATLELSAAHHLELEGVLEKDAVVDFVSVEAPPRRWTLRVGHVDFVGIQESSLRFVANLYPAMWLLKLTTNTRKFRNMSAEQIISQVLSAQNVAHRFELTRPTEVRKYCAQYRETNLDFVHRLLEFEGIYYTFEPDGTVVFGDTSEDGAPTAGTAAFDLVESAGLSFHDVGIFRFKKGRRVASGAATVNDYNWKTPKVSLLSSKAAAEDGELEVYDYPTGFRKPDQGTRLAALRLEALRVPARYVEGQSNVTSFEPGRRFTFGGITHPRFAGDYVLTEVTHRYVDRAFVDQQDGEGLSYDNEFSAIPRKVAFRPPLVTPRPEIAGCHTATVVGPEGEEIHTDKHGRYRAQFHWDREATGTDQDSRWLRNTQEVQTGMVLARVGWEQSIAYVDGDPDRPFGFARNINGQMVPEYAQPTNKTRMTMKSPSYPSAGGGFNELRMEDIAGQQHWDWHAQRDMTGQIDNDRSEEIGNDEVHKVGDSFTWSVGHDQQLSVGGNLTVKASNAYTFAVSNDRQCKVGGNDELKIAEVYSYTIEGTCTQKIGGDLKVKAAEETGTITRQVGKSWERKIGGDWQIDGKGNLDIRAQGHLIEKVGGNKVITCDKNISYRVSGKVKTEVGASCTRKSGESMGMSANNTKIEVGRHALLRADEQITINGNEILLQAEQRLELRSGALGLVLTPQKAELEGAMKLEAGSEIKLVGVAFNTTK